MSLVLLAVRWVVLRRRPWGWRLSSGEIASQSHADCRAVAPWPSPQAGARGPVVTRERLPCAFTGRGRGGGASGTALPPGLPHRAGTDPRVRCPAGPRAAPARPGLPELVSP